MYQPPTGNTGNLLSQDNSHLEKKVRNGIASGNNKYNSGNSLPEKEQGLSEIMQALKQLSIWINREQEPKKQSLQELYNSQYQSLKSKIEYIENYKKSLNGQPQVMQDGDNSKLGGKQGSGGGGNNESDKFKDMLGDAIVTEKPNVKWEDIAGLEQAKTSLKEAVILPIKFPQIFHGNRKPWKGILLYGPPGTGKTFLAKACATECDATFFSISAADLVSKYVGETEKMIKGLFNLAREKKPSIIFIDECDSMFGARGDGQQESSRRAITEFLTQMQGVGRDDEGVLVLGASNLPWALDAAVRRRFEKRIYIPLPDYNARGYMINRLVQKQENNIQQHEMQQFAQNTEGYSGSDIGIIVKDAVMQPLRLLQTTDKFRIVGQQFMPVKKETPAGGDVVVKDYMSLENDQLKMPPLSGEDFAISVQKCKPSVGKEQLQEYVNFTQTFGQDG